MDSNRESCRKSADIVNRYFLCLFFFISIYLYLLCELRIESITH